MATNFPEYIKTQIQAVEPTAQVMPGGALSDLMISPLASILGPYGREHAAVLSNMTLRDPDQLTETAMNDIVSSFLVSRNPGEYARGYVRIYFSSPQSITIPAGTIFSTTDGRRYQSIGAYSISRGEMLINSLEYPLYSTGNIAIQALATGESYNASPGVINTVNNIPYSPAKVRNPLPVSAGVDIESNIAFLSRLRTRVNNMSLASPNGIELTLKDAFPTITDVRVVGAGHDDMVRDLSYSGFTLEDIQIDDFYGKVSGLWEYPYNRSIAYFDVFQDTDPTTNISVPSAASFSTEYTTPMYATLYYNDAMFVELTNKLIVEEYFLNSGYHASWVTSDGVYGYGEAALHEIEVDTNFQAIRLGWDEIFGWVLVPPSIIVDLFNHFNPSGSSGHVQSPWGPWLISPEE